MQDCFRGDECGLFLEHKPALVLSLPLLLEQTFHLGEDNKMNGIKC